MYGLLLTVDRVLAKFSPVMIMQRFIRGWLTRLKLKRSGIVLPKFVSSAVYVYVFMETTKEVNIDLYVATYTVTTVT